MTSDTRKSNLSAEQRILEVTLALADEKGWKNIRLYQVANHLNIGLGEIHKYYPDLNAIANKWFTHALTAMLTPEEGPFFLLPAQQRLQLAIIKWFNSLALHHKTTTQMVGGKLHPPHIQHWVPMVFDLSSLIHWWLDAAAIAVSGRQRQIAEIGLTAIFLRSFYFWTNDRSPNQSNTAEYLRRRLANADMLMAIVTR